MTISYLASPVQMCVENAWKQLTPPFALPYGDPGGSSGGAASITILQGTDAFGRPIPKVMWSSDAYDAGMYHYAGQVADNAGGAQPTATGSEVWYPHGFHNWGSISFSEEFGVVSSHNPGLNSQTGRCEYITACFNCSDWRNDRRWRMLLAQKDRAHHFLFDYKARRDIVMRYSDGKLYYLNGTSAALKNRGELPAVSASVLWERDKFAIDNGLELADAPPYRAPEDGDGGYQRYGIPWRNEFWVMQYISPALHTLWGGNLGTGASFIIPLPSEVMTWIKAANALGFDNCPDFVIDKMNRRVLMALVDMSGVTSSAGPFPMALYQVNTLTRAFTRLKLPATLMMEPPGVVWVRHLNFTNGHKFVYLKPRTSEGIGTHKGYTDPVPALTWTAGAAYSDAHPDGNARYTNGGYEQFDIWIPPANAPREITVVDHPIPTANNRQLFNKTGAVYITQRECLTKHSTLCQSPVDLRMYVAGGDVGGGTDSNSGIFSFIPDGPTDASFRVDQPYAQAGQFLQPFNQDECAFEHRGIGSVSEFWLYHGYRFPTGSALPNSGQIAPLGATFTWTEESYLKACNEARDWVDVTRRIWRWRPPYAAVDPGKWTCHTPTFPLAGTITYPEQVWYVGESVALHGLRHDPVTDRMIHWAMGARAIAIIDCKTYETRNYRMDRDKILGTSGKLPDGSGRTIADAIRFNSEQVSWMAMDQATGKCYVISVDGDLWEIDTRAAPYTESGGTEACAVSRWLFRTGIRFDNASICKLDWANGALWIYVHTQSRGRLWSWAPGEANAYEHPQNLPMIGENMAMYRRADGSEHLCLWATTWCAYTQGMPEFDGYKYQTIELR